MPRAIKAEPAGHARESSFVSLLSGWVQQGVENFFATQRILVDLAMRQNASAMNFVRDQMTDSEFCPMGVITELAGEGMTNFIEGQKLLLHLAQKEYELVTTGVKERVEGFPPAVAATDFLRRGYDTFVEMQLDFLKIASKQTHTWLAAIKAGKGFDADGLVETARDSFDTFVRSQKKFLEVVVEEATNATSRVNGAKKAKKTELVELAREATDSFVDAQKKLLDVAARQMNAQLNATEHTLNMIPASPFSPLPDLTRRGVKSFIDAEKALIDTVTNRQAETKAATTDRHKKRPARTIKVKTAHAHAAHA